MSRYKGSASPSLNESECLSARILSSYDVGMGNADDRYEYSAKNIHEECGYVFGSLGCVDTHERESVGFTVKGEQMDERSENGVAYWIGYAAAFIYMSIKHPIQTIRMWEAWSRSQDDFVMKFVTAPFLWAVWFVACLIGISRSWH